MPKAAAPKKAAGKEKAEGAAATAGGKKPRKKKDPNAPKGALSAFMYFSQDQRAAVKEANPGGVWVDRVWGFRVWGLDLDVQHAQESFLGIRVLVARSAGNSR